MIKRSKADHWFSKCIRERANYKCERCGKEYTASSTGLHCSHHFSRSHRPIRWCKDNALALCFSCHNWYAGNPVQSGRWLSEKLGETMIAILEEKLGDKTKISKEEEKEIAAHYKAEFEKMVAQRAEGKTELDFESWQ